MYNHHPLKTAPSQTWSSAITYAKLVSGAASASHIEYKNVGSWHRDQKAGQWLEHFTQHILDAEGTFQDRKTLSIST